ncbi:MAG: TonB-dependent receptor [Bacteroidia bacterium]|nr:TonB-dependent receptor [Bacteroidia bacterium]NNC84922.1 TonB-dependent receptor [Bacteroidia bacterium]NNM15656.1 TonB-dependent receptor [Bacteroidia bacterium]
MKNILTVVAFVFSITSMYAQVASIKGKITGGDNYQPLLGATVLIQGTGNGAAADFDGNYTIKGVKPGTYNLVCRNISYTSDTIKGVVINAGDEILQDFNLNSSSLAIGAVKIEGRALMRSEFYMIDLKQNSAELIDGISAQQIARSGDSDVASAAKRIVGVNVEGGKYVYVRGLSDRYSKTLLNGADVPGLDPDRNSVQMDLIPSNLIDNIVVSKSFTPDLPGNFTGGLVQVLTKDYPENFTIKFSTSFAYNTQSSLNNDFLSSESGSTDFLGFDNGDRDVPGLANGEIPDIQFTSNMIQDNKELSDIGKSFKSSFYPEAKNSFLNHSHSFSIGNNIKLFKRKFGYITGLTYSKKYNYYSDGFVGRYSLTGSGAGITELNTESDLNDEKGEESVLWGALLNLSYKISENSSLSLHLLKNQNGVATSRFVEGEIPKDAIGLYQQSRAIGYKERSLNSVQLKGEHELAKKEGAMVDWISSYTSSSQKEPDLRFFNDDYELVPSIDGTTDTLYSISTNLYDPPTRYFRDMEETNMDVKANMSFPILTEKLIESKIKFGVAGNWKNREFNERRFNYADQDMEFDGNVADYFNEDNFNVGQSSGYTYVQDATDLRNSYTGEEQIYAGYAMVDIKASAKWRFITGARFESTTIDIASKDEKLEEGSLVTNDVLPSINTTYSINEKMNLRLALSRTIAKPTFRELAPFASYDFLTRETRIGNPDLQRTVVDNVDFRWELFPNRGETFSIGFFYKRFTDPIEVVFNPLASNDELTWRNVNRGNLYGAEVEIKKSLDFIMKRFENYSIGANISAIESSVKIDAAELADIHSTDPDHPDSRYMFGQSPYIVNAFLRYEQKEKGWNAALNFNTSGEKLVVVIKGGTPNVFEQPRLQLDANLGKKLGEHFGVKIAAKNLLDSPYKLTQDFKDEEYIYRSYNKGITYSFGVTYLVK